MNFLLESIFNIECTRIKRNSHTEKQRRITVSVWLFLKDIVFLWSFLRSLLNSEVPLEGSYIFIYFFSNLSILFIFLHSNNLICKNVVINILSVESAYILIYIISFTFYICSDELNLNINLSLTSPSYIMYFHCILTRLLTLFFKLAHFLF